MIDFLQMNKHYFLLWMDYKIAFDVDIFLFCGVWTREVAYVRVCHVRPVVAVCVSALCLTLTLLHVCALPDSDVYSRVLFRSQCGCPNF